MFNIHLGLLNQHIPGPTNPTKASELFTAKGNWKFTVVLQPGVPLIVENDMRFVVDMMLSQMQAANVRFGAADKDNNYVVAKEGQMALFVFRKPHSGYADVVAAPKLRFEAEGGPRSPSQTATFAYGAGIGG